MYAAYRIEAVKKKRKMSEDENEKRMAFKAVKTAVSKEVGVIPAT